MRPLPTPFEECACAVELKMMYVLCGELEFVSVIGQVRGEE